MLSQARPRTCTLLRRNVYALSPKHSSQWQRTNGWELTVPSRNESARWVHREFRRIEGARKPQPPPSDIPSSSSLQDVSRLELTSNVVATTGHVSDMLQTISQLSLSTDTVLYLNCEGAVLSRNGDISIISVLVEPTRHVYIVDVQELGEQAFTTTGSGTSLKQILESADIIKAFFDVRSDADALFGLYGIRLRGVEDIQLLENAHRPGFTRKYLHSLARCVEQDAPVDYAQKEAWIETQKNRRSLFYPEGGDGCWRFNERPLSQENRYAKFVHRWAFSGPYLISWAGIGVSVGEFITASRRSDDDTTVNGWGLAGTIIFLLFFVTTAVLAAIFFRRRVELPDGERAQVKCVTVACLPAMAVRIVYSLVGRFPGPARETFSPIQGFPTAYLLLAALPELVVVGACTATILRHGRDWRVYYKSAASEEVVHGSQDGVDLRNSNARV
ncbi:hypothetical protein PspLS_00703 [Pyricularia sp. CBS 133598]|nr:hypothetical protein PspLS_00703 [Pyricularia sp. CBS 133598]